MSATALPADDWKSRSPQEDSSRRPTVLVVDDDESQLEFAEEFLTQMGLNVLTAGSGSEGLRVAADVVPELVIVDLHMRGMNGDEVCRRLRGADWPRYIPVLVMTAEKRPKDEARLIDEFGADDYVVKGCSNLVFAARVRRLLRGEKFRLDGNGRRAFGAVVFDAERRELSAAGRTFRFTRIETAILSQMIGARGLIVSGKVLFRESHGYWPRHHSTSLKVHISHIRGKLGKFQELIESLRNGYRFNVQFAVSLAPRQG